MGESNRGTYDADQIRVFDGSEDDDEAEGSRLPVLIVIALVVLFAFAGVVWLAYQKGVASGRSEPRVVVADTDNVNSSPATNSGNPTEYKGLKIYEQPAPNDADQSTAPGTTDAQKPAPKTQPAQTAALPLRAPVTEPSDAVTAQAVAPTAPPPPVPVKPKPEKKVAVAAPVTEKPVTAKPVAAAPVEASEPPRTLSPAVTSPPAHAAAGGEYLLQIGSYKSEEEANASWASDKKKYGSVLAGYSPNVKQVDLGEKGTWYRLRIASFADKSSANDLCDKLKAAGGSCIISK
jgi:cell division protein FtsN